MEDSVGGPKVDKVVELMSNTAAVVKEAGSNALQAVVRRADGLLEEEEDELLDPKLRQQSVLHWSKEQQQQLEDGIRFVGAGRVDLSPMEWDQISQGVDGKSGVECMDRSMYLRRLSRRLSRTQRPPLPSSKPESVQVADNNASFVSRASGLLSSLFGSSSPSGKPLPPSHQAPGLFFVGAQTVLEQPFSSLPSRKVHVLDASQSVRDLYDAFAQGDACVAVKGDGKSSISCLMFVSWLAHMASPTSVDSIVVANKTVQNLLEYYAGTSSRPPYLVDSPPAHPVGVADILRQFCAFDVSHVLVRSEAGAGDFFTVALTDILRVLLPHMGGDRKVETVTAPTKSTNQSLVFSDELLVSCVRFVGGMAFQVFDSFDSTRFLGQISLNSVNKLGIHNSCTAMHRPVEAFLKGSGAACPTILDSASVLDLVNVLIASDSSSAAVVNANGRFLRSVSARDVLFSLSGLAN